jgi:F0F1-type ATP synthase membrane subunit a
METWKMVNDYTVRHYRKRENRWFTPLMFFLFGFILMQAIVLVIRVSLDANSSELATPQPVEANVERN